MGQGGFVGGGGSAKEEWKAGIYGGEGNAGREGFGGLRCGSAHPTVTVLYMATLAATRHNPVIKTFYDRLCGQGKAKKLALTACMRKLLIILNAMLKNNTSWNNSNSLSVIGACD